MKFQQMTGPLMAKGLEDTALYIFNRLLSLNEVGGNPGHFGITAEQFHAFNQNKCDRWLHAMNATATHDTKRGEDVRARLNVLSEIPAEWERQVQRWSELNQAKKTQIQRRALPDRNDEYFLYQTLIGAFPFTEAELPEFVQRVKDYVVKAVREAKVHTAWLRPDNTYEESYLQFVEGILHHDEFLQAFRPFQQRVAEYGMFNSLAQVLLKNASPGVPDLYQGNELWDLSLVDPDNRRPVDYERRIAFLHEIQERSQRDILGLIDEMLAVKEDGRVKLFLTHRILQARKANLDLFQTGDYQPLEVTGKFANHIIAFARKYEGQVAIAIATRFLTSLIQPGELPLGEQVWQDTHIRLPAKMPTSWTNAITAQPLQCQQTLFVGTALQHFPAVLLLSE
jgi:(1->4)-alpha-D-glucan 1-alpha-D-glucosylmutase